MSEEPIQNNAEKILVSEIKKENEKKKSKLIEAQANNDIQNSNKEINSEKDPTKEETVKVVEDESNVHSILKEESIKRQKTEEGVDNLVVPGVETTEEK